MHALPGAPDVPNVMPTYWNSESSAYCSVLSRASRPRPIFSPHASAPFSPPSSPLPHPALRLQETLRLTFNALSHLHMSVYFVYAFSTGWRQRVRKLRTANGWLVSCHWVTTNRLSSIWTNHGLGVHSSLGGLRALSGMFMGLNLCDCPLIPKSVGRKHESGSREYTDCGSTDIDVHTFELLYCQCRWPSCTQLSGLAYFLLSFCQSRTT